MIRILYFARLRELLGLSEESVELNDSIATVDQLRQFLCDRGEPWTQTLQRDGLFISINHNVVQDEHPIKDGDEVAFFPPVTGG